MTTKYTTIADYINQAVKPALENFARDFDDEQLENIARAVLQEEYTDNKVRYVVPDTATPDLIQQMARLESTELYWNRDQAIQLAILPLLGDFADDFDVDAIADEILDDGPIGSEYRVWVRDDLTDDAITEILQEHDTSLNKAVRNPDRFIISPKQIANGFGAWQGTIRELVEKHHYFGRFIEALDIPDGDDDDPDYEDVYQAMTYKALCQVLDDPNTIVTNMTGNQVDHLLELQFDVQRLEAQTDNARYRRDLLAHKLIEAGMTRYQVAKQLGMSDTAVKKMVDRVKDNK